MNIYKESITNFYLRHMRNGCFTPRVILSNGKSLSVQASEHHYCAPRRVCDYYYEVEVGFPDEVIKTLLEYAEDADNPKDTVYPYVPIELVDEYITSCGGIHWELTKKRIAIDNLKESERTLGL